MNTNLANVVGKSFTEAVSELCLAASPQWRGFKGEFSLNNSQTIFTRPGNWWPGDRAADEEQRERRLAERFRKALAPLFDMLRNGDLAVLAVRLSRLGESPEPLRAHLWDERWHIHLDDGRKELHLLDCTEPDDAAWKLLKVVAVAPGADLTAKQAEAQTRTDKTTSGGKPRRPRGPSRKYVRYLDEMEKLIRSGVEDGPWQAATKVVEAGPTWTGGTAPSKIKKLYAEYIKSGRPQDADALTSTRVTHK